jgi:bleomycin hydrolase
MKRPIFWGILFLFIPTVVWAQAVKYVPQQRTGIIEQLIQKADSIQAVKDSITSAIRDGNGEPDAETNVIRFDISGIVKPTSLEDFNPQFHFPPLGQYRTGTCWCFSTTSCLETEVARETGRKVKLSEMHTVYYEYVEKARNYVRTRATDWNGEGSESEAVLYIMKQYGAVPEDIYSGYISDSRYDHNKMADEIGNHLNYVSANNYWDEDKVVGSVKLILNKYMGAPPEHFIFEGKTITPLEFLRDVMKINLDDYVACMSTLSKPFNAYGEFEVWDNWRHDSAFYNLPLDDWYGVIKKVINGGNTLALGGDVSEPGYIGEEDIAIVPEFDIPQNNINQDSRELRIYNETTTDDHAVHIIGYTNIAGRDWYLAKDSSRRLAQGKFEGYVFYRDDYIRLKMLTFLVHKDALEKALGKKL